jgi:asparagine synthase (glutamine-hydrolysing)
LREQLQTERGYRFFSTSDTEVLMKAYHAWGDGFVERLQGMFAFVIHERDTGRSFLGRDRFGIKPLYLAEAPGRLRFASSLPALLAGGDVDTTIDPIALHHYLTFHAVVPAPHTILQGIRKVPPATTIAIEPDGSRKVLEFWEPDFTRDPDRADWTERDWEDAVLASLRQAVEWRTVADVPVGVLLSGGLDSSMVVGLLAEAGQRGINTFSIGFESVGGEEGDEFKYSDVIAREFDTDHHRIRIGTDRMLPALHNAVAAMSEPMVSHDAVAFFLLSQEVAKHVKVVQSGQGADEVFAGLPLVPAHAGAHERARRGRPRPAGRCSGRSLPGSVLRPAARGAGRGAASGAPHRAGRVARVRRRALPAGRRADRDRHGAAARLADHAGRRPGQAGRQHDDGVGARGAGPVPRPRGARCRRPHPARSSSSRRRARACSRRPPAASSRAEVIDRPKGYFPVPALKYLQGPYLELVRDALHAPEARERGLFE